MPFTSLCDCASSYCPLIKRARNILFSVLLWMWREILVNTYDADICEIQRKWWLLLVMADEHVSWMCFNRSNIVTPTFGSLPCLSMRDMTVRMCCSYLQWEIWWCVCVAPTFGSLPCLSMSDMMVRMCCSYLWVSAMFVNERYDGAYVLLLPLGLCHVCQWVIWWCVCVAPTFWSLPCLSMRDMMVRMCCSYLQWEIWWCVCVAPTFGSLRCLSMRDMMVRMCCSYLWVSAMFVNERYDGAYVLLLPSMRDMMVRMCCSYLWVSACLSMSDMMVRMCCSYLQWEIWWCVYAAPTFNERYDGAYMLLLPLGLCMFVNERYDGAYVLLLPSMRDMMVRICCSYLQWEIWWCVCVAPTFGSLHVCQWVIWWCVCVAPTFNERYDGAYMLLLPSMRDMMVRICCSYLWVSACLSMSDMMVRMCCSYLQWEIWWCVYAAPTFNERYDGAYVLLLPLGLCMFVNEWYDGAYMLLLPLGLCHVCQWEIWWCVCVAPTFGSLPCLSMRDMMVRICCSYLQCGIWWCVYVAPTFGSLPCLSMSDMMVRMCCSYLWVSAMFVNERYDGAYVLLLPLGLCHVCQWVIWWCVCVAPTFNERYDGAYVLLLPLGLCHVCQWVIWWCVCVAPTFGSLPCLSMRDMMVRMCCSYLWVSAMFVNEWYDGAYVLLLPLGLCHVCQWEIWWCVCVAPTCGSLPCLSMSDMMVRMCCSYLWVSAMFVNERYDGAYVLLLPLGLCHVCQWEIWWCVCVAPTFGSLPCLSMRDMMVRMCCSYLRISAMFVNERYDGAYVLLLDDIQGLRTVNEDAV